MIVDLLNAQRLEQLPDIVASAESRERFEPADHWSVTFPAHPKILHFSNYTSRENEIESMSRHL